MEDETNLDELFEEALASGDGGEPEAGEAQADTSGQQGSEEGQQAENDPSQQASAKKPPMPPEERSRQAYGRRAREREARAYQAGLDYASEIIKRARITNPKANGALVEDLKGLKDYADAQSDRRIAEGRANGEDIQRIVDARLQTVRQPAQQDAQLSAADQQAVDRQLAQIRAMDPAMTGLPAILESEAGEKFREYVDMGLDFVDAYTLAAKDRLANIGANRSGARGGGKDHLSGTSQRGAGAIDVPPSEMKIIRALNPDISEADIRKFYDADKRKFGG